MTSVSETAIQNHFCLVWQVRLAWQLRLAWFYFDPFGTFAPLAGLHRLISCPTTISSHNHYYRSQVLSVRQIGLANFLRSFVSLRLTPALRSATSLNGSLSYSLENTSAVATTHTATRNHQQ